MRLALALLLFSAVPGRATVTAEETALSERLSKQADEFLASILGAGRGKVIVAVEGEQMQSSFQSESVAPASKPAGETRVLLLPGYGKGKEDQVLKETTGGGGDAGPANGRKSLQSSTLESGLQIMRMRVSVVLDSRLPQEQVAAVTNLLPEFLHLDTTRGDELAVLRADLRLENWRSAAKGYLLSKEGVGTVTVLAGIMVLLLLSSVLIRFTANSAIQTFAGEFSSRRLSPSLPFGSRAGADSPELLAGGIPRLDVESDEPRLAAPAPPLLGQRFDFLASRSPGDLAKLLGAEPAEELALLFAALTASHPDLAASLFTALAPDTRAEVSLSLAGMTSADPERLEALENRLKDAVNFGVRGPERLGEILSRLPQTERESLLKDVVSANPDIAAELERSLFSFEDVFQLDVAGFRRAISAVPYAEWGVAMRGAPGDMADRLLAELDRGAQTMLKEIMATPQARSKVLEARSKIITRVLMMAARGEIAMSRESSEML